MNMGPLPSVPEFPHQVYSLVRSLHGYLISLFSRLSFYRLSVGQQARVGAGTSMHSIAGKLRSWFDHNFTIKGLGAATLFLICGIPDWSSRTDYWKTKLHTIMAFLGTVPGRIVIMAIGVMLIWMDHRAVLARHRVPTSGSLTSPNSLRERIFSICQELTDYAAKREPRPDDDVLWKKIWRGWGRVHGALQR